MLRSLLAAIRPAASTGAPAHPDMDAAAAPQKGALISAEEFEALSARHAGDFDKSAYSEELAQMVGNAMRARLKS